MATIAQQVKDLKKQKAQIDLNLQDLEAQLASEKKISNLRKIAKAQEKVIAVETVTAIATRKLKKEAHQDSGLRPGMILLRGWVQRMC